MKDFHRSCGGCKAEKKCLLTARSHSFILAAVFTRALFMTAGQVIVIMLLSGHKQDTWRCGGTAPRWKQGTTVSYESEGALSFHFLENN